MFFMVNGSGLEKLVKGMNTLASAQNVLQTNRSYDELQGLFDGYKAQGEDIESPRWQGLYQGMLKQENVQRAFNAHQLAGKAQGDIVSEVDSNLNHYVGKLDEGELRQLAINYSNEAESIRQLAEVLERNNTDALMGILSEGATNWYQLALQTSNSSLLMEVGKSVYRSRIEKFTKDSLSKEVKEGDRVVKYEFDREKAINFVSGAVKDNAQAYLNIASYVVAKKKD